MVLTRLILLTCLLVLPLASAQGGPAEVLSADERAWLGAHGPIRYAPDPGYPPFEAVLAEGTVEGINVDFLNRMSRNLGIQFETVIYDNWTAVLDGMQAGEVDLLGSLAQTPERDEYMDFYGPYMQLGEVFYVRTDSPYTTNEQMTDKRVAVIRDYAAGAWIAENYPGVERVEVDNMRAGLEAVTTGKVDAFFENVPVAGYAILKEGFSNIKILDEPLYYSPANWGVPKDTPELLSIIGKGMASISYGERTAIFEYWSGYDLGVQPATATRAAWITPTLWGMAGFGLITVAWIGLLRRTVASRTSQLRQLNNELENRVHERTSELEEANRYLDGFASSVSHDLQQPLNVLRLENKLASMRVEKGETPNFEKIERQIIRMSGFIETMLHFSRGERILELVNVPLEPIVREIEAVYGESEDAKAEITVAKDLVAYCDPQLIRIVLLNIVGNAWKFSAQHSGAKIEVGGDGTEFFVRDNGPGFDADTLGEDVFKPFVRGGTEGNVGGTGVGLATAARIVRRHGGKIWVESSPGNGATFTFTFPPPNK